MTKTKIDAKEYAANLKRVADQEGFIISIKADILTITKHFPAGDKKAFCDCDMMYSCVFDHLPRTSPGSDWGTDGGGVGGMFSIYCGTFVMNRSGGNKRILKELSKLI